MPNERENRSQTREEPQAERASRNVAEARIRVPRSVNLHLDHRCNYRCRFCYFTEAGHRNSVPVGVEPTLPLEDLLRLQRTLTRAGVERVTYAGGEPTLCPHLDELILQWHQLHGAASPRAMIVTNGAALYESRLRRLQLALAAVKLSVDSASEATEAELGRGRGNHVALAIRRAETLHRIGIPVDLNSVVCRLNLEEDFTPLVRAIQPRYWKVFQMLPVPGQNDSAVDDLAITAPEFSGFLGRHQHLHDVLVAEDNNLMQDSYAMLDPLGRFFQSTPEGYRRGTHSVLEVGVERALSEVSLNWQKYDRRGGDERAFGARRLA